MRVEHSSESSGIKGRPYFLQDSAKGTAKINMEFRTSTKTADPTGPVDDILTYQLMTLQGIEL